MYYSIIDIYYKNKKGYILYHLDKLEDEMLNIGCHLSTTIGYENMG